MKVLEWYNISLILSLWDFFRRSMAANSAVRLRIWPNFELIRDFMVGFLTCKDKEDLIENKDGTVLTSLKINFSNT